FFFQAEDGIRDRNVTGVQTCALPIYLGEGLAQPLVGFRIVPRADEAHREDVVAELDRVHHRVVPLDDAFLLQPLDPVVDRGGGEPGLLRQVAEADLVVLLEPLQNDSVRALDVFWFVRPFGLRPRRGEAHQLTPARPSNTWTIADQSRSARPPAIAAWWSSLRNAVIGIGTCVWLPVSRASPRSFRINRKANVGAKFRSTIAFPLNSRSGDRADPCKITSSICW